MPQEEAEFEAFKAGARIDPQAMSNEYTDRLRRQAAEGRIQGRVHIRAPAFARIAPAWAG